MRNVLPTQPKVVSIIDDSSYLDYNSLIKLKKYLENVKTTAGVMGISYWKEILAAISTTIFSTAGFAWLHKLWKSREEKKRLEKLLDYALQSDDTTINKLFEFKYVDKPADFLYELIDRKLYEIVKKPVILFHLIDQDRLDLFRKHESHEVWWYLCDAKNNIDKSKVVPLISKRKDLTKGALYGNKDLMNFLIEEKNILQQLLSYRTLDYPVEKTEDPTKSPSEGTESIVRLLKPFDVYSSDGSESKYLFEYIISEDFDDIRYLVFFERGWMGHPVLSVLFYGHWTSSESHSYWFVLEGYLVALNSTSSVENKTL